MKSLLIRLLPTVTIMLASACSGAPAGQDTEKTKLVGPVVRARGDVAGLKVALAVVGVDEGRRLITLRGPAGNTGTYPVPSNIKRLSEIHAGDRIQAEYSVAALAELRDPNAEEEKAPLIFAETLERRATSQSPGGTLLRSARVVTVIDAIDPKAGTVTLRGPLDGQVVTKVDDVSVLPWLRVGQRVISTFDETLILSVESGTKKQ